MKKFLLIIFLFLSCINVFASERTFVGSEFITGVSYVKDAGSVIQYRNAQVIRDASTGEIAYCVEPFSLMVNYSEYSNGEDNFNSRFGIGEEAWEKIKLYAYYGYGYKDHTDIKWVNITQMSIWRTITPYYRYEWINNVNDREVIYPFENELKELNTLVNNHYTLPSLNNEYTTSIDKEIVLEDSNQVLNNYKIISSDFDARIYNNQIIINPIKEEKTGKIVIERGGEVFPETVKYFYSSESQNVMERGNIKPIKKEITINVKEGKIKVNKIDSDTKDNNAQGQAELNGAIFELLNEKKEIIKELTIENNYLEFNNLSFGTYYIREKKPGTGYYLNQKEYEVIIDKDNLEKEINIDNQVIKSRVKIIKLYGTKEDFDNNTMKKEENITFSIYDKNGINVFTGTTNNEGIIETSLPYGEYTVEQINTTIGYNKIEKFNFSINEDNSISYDIVLHDFKIDVPNASIDLFKLLSDMLKELIYV